MAQDTLECAAGASAGIPRVRAVACLGGVSLERDVPAEEISEYIAEPHNLVWVDVQDPGPEELGMLLTEFGFHPLALEDAAKGQQRPKVDEYRGYLFAVVHGVVSCEEVREFRTCEVDLFIGRNYVVSVHRGRVPALEDAFSRWTRGGQLMREGVGFLVYTIMDAIIDAYFPVVEMIEDEVDEAELRMFGGSSTRSTQGLLELKRTLFALRRVLSPLRETFSTFLRREHSFFSPNTFVYFQDVYDHILRILDVLDIERDRVTGALDAHMTVLSTELNVRMKTLTVLSVVVGLADCVLDAWGMGLGGTPFLHAAWGFWGVLALNIGLVVAILVLSWRRGWL